MVYIHESGTEDTKQRKYITDSLNDKISNMQDKIDSLGNK